MARRKKGRKEPVAGAGGGDASEAWMAVPVDESAIRTYEATVPDGEEGIGEEAPVAGADPNAGEANEGRAGLDSAFPLEEIYGRSDSNKGASYGEDSLDLLCFDLANETFGIDIRRVREIIRRRPATELPGVAEYVSGIISLRGAIVPVLDLRRRLGFERADAPMPEARIIVMDVAEKPAGVFVDSVSQKIRLPRSSMAPPPAVLGSAEAAFLLGICRHEGRLISVLNPERVMGIDAEAGDRPAGGAPAGGAA